MWPFSNPEHRVLMVCTANICRSPVAEALLRHELRRRKLHRKVLVASAGTEVGVPGVGPDPRMVALAGEFGISLRGLRASALDRETLDASDTIWVMERSHEQAIAKLDAEAGERVALLDPADEDIPDPYFGGKAGVRRVFEHIAECVFQRADQLAQQL